MKQSMITVQFVIFFCVISVLIFYICRQCHYNKLINVKASYTAKELFKANHRINIKNIQRGRTIPQHIYMTTKDKSKISQKVFDNLKKYATIRNVPIPYTIFDDDECTDFLTTYFKPVVLKLFNNLKHGAHKADLFRYCLLYVKGGIYFDIKTKLIKPIDKIFDFDSSDKMYTVIDRLGINDLNHGSFYQGIILTMEGNEIFLELISRMVRTGYKKIDSNYAIVCQQMKEIINDKTRGKLLMAGDNYLDNGLNCYLLHEKCETTTDSTCNKLDRYGFCCKIYDKNKHVIDTRFSDYGSWK